MSNVWKIGSRWGNEGTRVLDLFIRYNCVFFNTDDVSRIGDYLSVKRGDIFIVADGTVPVAMAKALDCFKKYEESNISFSQQDYENYVYDKVLLCKVSIFSFKKEERNIWGYMNQSRFCAYRPHNGAMRDIALMFWEKHENEKDQICFGDIDGTAVLLEPTNRNTVTVSLPTCDSQTKKQIHISDINQEEYEIRNKHLAVYKSLVQAFFGKISNLHIPDIELKSVPSLFLPACGIHYSQAKIKIAVVGERTLRWNKDLCYDLEHYKDGSYWNDELGYFSSFYHFQNPKEGPVVWHNNFWVYHAQVLETLLNQKGAFEKDNPVFSQVAWSNCWFLEKYNKHWSISSTNYWLLSTIVDQLRMRGLDFFFEVFSPDIVLYTCKNKYGSDHIFPKKETVCLAKSPPGHWPIIAWQYRSTLIIQTWHPSYLRRKKVYEQEFSNSVIQTIKELRGDLLSINN